MICLPDLSQNGHLMQGKETKEVHCKWSLKEAKGECICCEEKKGLILNIVVLLAAF